MQAQSLQVAGKAGFLQEWELAATVTADGSGRSKAYSGPLTLKHVGLCSTAGAEEKSGEIRLQMVASPRRIKATLVVDGLACAYNGSLSETETGLMDCPGGQGIPLSLWLK